MNKIEQQIADLEKRIKDLEINQVSIYMPYNIREVIRNSVIDKKIDDATSVSVLKRSQTVSGTIPAGGGSFSTSFDVPNDFNGVLTITWKDKVYKMPYYL